jgi:HEAT repeats
VTLADAAAQAEELAASGDERGLSQLRAQWDDELEAAARSADFRERALAFRAVGMFRWRAKEELLRRGLDDGSPAARGSALLSLELLSRDHPSTVNSVRPLLHKMLADEDENPAVRRLAVLVLKNGSAPRDTIVLLEGLAADDRTDGELRKAAGAVAQNLKRKAQEKR